MTQDDEVFQSFIEEARDHLQTIEGELLAIEETGNQADEESINRVFRAAHTIKGAAGFFGLVKIQELSHSMENLLNRVRDHQISLFSETITLLLEGEDVLAQMLDSPDESNQMDISSLVARLHSATEGPSSDTKASDSPQDSGIGFPGGPVIFQADRNEIAQAQRGEKGGVFVYLLRYHMGGSSEGNGKSSLDILSELQQVSLVIDSSVEEPEGTVFHVLCTSVLEPDIMTDYAGIGEQNVHQVHNRKIDVDGAQDHPADAPPAHPGEIAPKAAVNEPETPEAVEKDSTAPRHTQVPGAGQSGSVRVNLSLLDRLMTLAGELVLTRNELVQNAMAEKMDKIKEASQRVNSITSDLQESIMNTRMQSVGIVFNKFKRIVRDLAKNLGKEIDFSLEGEDVELDKTIIEAINDPMTHLVRNSVDHGIETPEVREKAGKTRKGSLHLKASHEAGQVVIEIIDDGGGIHPGKIAAKALETGLMTQEELSQLSPKEVIRLIFKAGFSTAEKVTDVSGRGVGMDVVQTNLSKVGGVIDIDSTPGKGTVIRVKLPLTLAIIPSLLVMVEKEQYAVPQVNLMELVRLQASEVKKKVEKIGDSVILRLRGDLLPLVRLRDIIGVPHPTYIDSRTCASSPDKRTNIADRRSVDDLEIDPVPADDPKEARNITERRKGPGSVMNIAVVAAGEFHYGLIVDALLDSEEIVVKPLGMHLKHLKEYAGATILGDGNVALILDVSGLKELAGLKHTSRLQTEREKRAGRLKDRQNEAQSLLLVENAPGEQFAVPMALVARIEKVPMNAIQNVGGRSTITYRDTSLLLLSLNDAIQCRPLPAAEHVFAVVFKLGNKELGFIFSEIVDILDSSSPVDPHSHKQPGVIGSAIIHDEIVQLLDLYALVDILAPEISAHAFKSDQDNSQYTLLLVEDSPFFMNQMVSFFEAAGYNVLTGDDGARGLEIFEAHRDEIDIIFSDIEMPNMNGFEMAQAIRSRFPGHPVPIIAVTSLAGGQSEKKAKGAGINEYLIKIDKEQILAKCREYLTAGKKA